MRPLDGLVVVDASQALVGPIATQTFGDFGADVIKIEMPGSGDLTRGFAPSYGPFSSYFVSLNRNKRSMTLDLRTEGGQAVLHDLVADADVFLQNFSPGKEATFGAEYETLRTLNESLIYCDISGYGPTSPYHDKKGFDIVMQAQSGIMGVTGTADGDPVRVGVSICDLSAGMTATYAVMTALYHRERTGEGQYIDISLLDTSFQFLLYYVTNYFATGTPPAPMGSKHPNLAPYQALPTADSHVVVGVVSNHLWPGFCRAVDRPEWIDDDRFATNADRVRNRETLDPMLDELFATRTTAGWIEALDAEGVPCSPVNTIADIVEDPHFEARGMLEDVIRPDGERFRVPGNPVHFSTLDVDARRPPPTLGEHTHEILAERGYSPTDIDRLREDGVI